jgi:hypothetical protein
MKTKLIALAILAGSSMFAQSRLSVGIQVGGYGQGYYDGAPVYASDIPPCPGPDYDWVDGYWSQDYGRRSWIAGSWNRRQFERPRYDNRFYGNAYRGNSYGGSYGGNSYSGNDRRESYSRPQWNDRGGERGRSNDRGGSRENYNQNSGRYGNGFRGR